MLQARLDAARRMLAAARQELHEERVAHGAAVIELVRLRRAVAAVLMDRCEVLDDAHGRVDASLAELATCLSSRPGSTPATRSARKDSRMDVKDAEKIVLNRARDGRLVIHNTIVPRRVADSVIDEAVVCAARPGEAGEDVLIIRVIGGRIAATGVRLPPPAVDRIVKAIFDEAVSDLRQTAVLRGKCATKPASTWENKVMNAPRDDGRASGETGSELVAFLRAQLDEEEREARMAATMTGAGGRWVLADDITLRSADGAVKVAEVEPKFATHLARYDPERILAEVAAKRRIIDEYAGALRIQHGFRETSPEVARREALELVCRLLALPYAGRPGYQEVWRP